MQKVDIDIADGKTAKGFVIELGPANLVFAKTDKVMIACGAFDIMVLDKFNFAAVKIKALTGSIKGIDDLLSGKAVLVNDTAKALGVTEALAGWEVLEIV